MVKEEAPPEEKEEGLADAVKVEVLDSDMNSEFEASAREICLQAVAGSKHLKDIAFRIKHSYDKKYPGSGKATEGVYHCIVGTNFASEHSALLFGCTSTSTPCRKSWTTWALVESLCQKGTCRDCCGCRNLVRVPGYAQPTCIRLQLHKTQNSERAVFCASCWAAQQSLCQTIFSNRMMLMLSTDGLCSTANLKQHLYPERLEAKLLQSPTDTGRFFSGAISHETHQYIKLRIGTFHVILWKSKDSPFHFNEA